MSSCKEISPLRLLLFSDNKYSPWWRGTAPRQTDQQLRTPAVGRWPSTTVLGMKLFSLILFFHHYSSSFPFFPPAPSPLRFSCPAGAQALGGLTSLLAWADRSAMPRGRWGRDNSRLRFIRQAKTEAWHQLFLSWKKPVRAFFQLLLGVFPPSSGLNGSSSRVNYPDLWPQEDHWPIYEEIHLIWLHTSLTAVKGGGFGFGFWFLVFFFVLFFLKKPSM